jgi:precorrin-6A synthase
MDLEIYWGAYLGGEDEVLISGKLDDVVEEIRRTRRTLRERKGWIMDSYLLRRTHATDLTPVKSRGRPAV